MTRTLSLKLRFGLGAAVLGLATLVTVAVLMVGMSRVSARMTAALASEHRMDRYAALSTQVSTFFVVSAEAIQTGLPADQRTARMAQVSDTIRQTFARLRGELAAAVVEASELGLDEQSRRATQTLGLARMEAQFRQVTAGLTSDTADRVTLRAHLDNFASNFEPLLAEMVNEENRLRTNVLAGIGDLRTGLERTALAIAAVTVLMLLAFHFGLVRPQLRRLDALGDAARRVGAEDFSVVLPDSRPDEIGRLYAETNRMTAALAARKAEIDAEWSRLNDTIAERTEDLRLANARLERTDEDRRRFFADISHELRTPLTVILMESQLGRKTVPLAAEAFTTIENRAARLNRRIDDLLRVARSETGQLALEDGAVPVAEMLSGMAEETRAEIANAGMTLSLDCVPGITARGDANWLRQVVSGLVRNAIRYARDGGVIDVTSRAEGGFAVIEVTDRGPGIPAGMQDSLFTRFTQGSNPERGRGFGLGLALARWVVEAQGGTMHLQSPARDADKTAPGTTILLHLPLDAG
ncbi:ATP-binding protein [Salipiger sp.]|uniref:sensor histidine kinase n=1 Tax=Salipiger sp. TaxID=2078585 RepID=UPI003A96B6B8